MMRADNLTVVVARNDRDVPITYTDASYHLHRDGVTVVTHGGATEHHDGLHVVDVLTYNRAAPAA